MTDVKRGEDAADKAPKPGKDGTTGSAPPDRKQDAANYDERTDKGQAIEIENMSSANDEGAN